MKIRNAISQSKRWRLALDVVGRAMWQMPNSFGIAECLGRHYSLRCVLFHHVADSETDFTRGLGVTTTPQDFESALKFLVKYYTPVSLQDVLAESYGQRVPSRPVLMTFDDAYESVREVAAPLCQKYGVPAVFFVNAGFLDNRRLAFDNLVCYAANVMGLEQIEAAADEVSPAHVDLLSVKDVFNHFVPAISLPTREAFRKALIGRLGADEAQLASAANLYLTTQQLRDLRDFNIDIGNHTYTHVNCRHLTRQDLDGEIDRNKTELEALSGQEVKSFSVPYGSAADLPNDLVTHLECTGHKAAFLVDGVANRSHMDHFGFNRVSVKAVADAELFSEIEILPRFRSIRNWVSSIVSPAADRRISHWETVS
jgi:peptidoglycan/xylan/chitin deacetylase (PgdA/CDA1 family)